MLSTIYKYYNSVTAPAGRAGSVTAGAPMPQAGAAMDIEAVMDRHGLNLSAARVFRLIDRLVYASRLRGVVDKRGVPYCYASKEWMAERLGKSVRTIARAIRDLKAAGLIECRRTRANAMLFITDYGTDSAAETTPATVPDEKPAERAPSRPTQAMRGTSGNDKNGTSKINTQSINNNCVSPIHPSNPRRDGTVGRDNHAHQPPERGTTRPGDNRQAERLRISDALSRQLSRTKDSAGDILPARNATVDWIAEAVASGRDIRVNGTSISAGQYWDVVRSVNGARLEDTLRTIAARDSQGMIKNRRAYLLSSVYNCALWDRFGGIEPRYAKADTGIARKNPALDYDQREYREEDFGEGFFVDLSKYDQEGGARDE